MSIYAKTWCPAYPCDPCLALPATVIDSTGTDFDTAITDLQYCPADQSTSSVPTSTSKLQVLNVHENPVGSQFLGVRKWGLTLDTIPGSSPLRFCLAVHGTMKNGVPLALGPLSLIYGGITVLTVSGSIQGVTQIGSATVYPDGASVATFAGYVEVLSPDPHIIVGGTVGVTPFWEWAWTGAVSLPQTVTYQYYRPLQDVWQCHYPVPPTFNYHYKLVSQYVNASNQPYTIRYYRTTSQETSALRRSELGHRLPLVARFQGY